MVQDRYAEAKKFLNRYKVTFPNGLDNSGIAERYGLQGHPTMFFISEKGEILGRRIGAIDEETLKLYIKTVFEEGRTLPEQAPIQ